ncbi:MAG: 2'-5' RNA ligase family protein [Patescibacteria group bacterium]|jgi:2'-5' RNA ligase
MEEKYIRLGLSFQVPPVVSDKAVAMSQELATKYKAKFVLDAKNFYPHITIYPPSYPAKNLPKIIANVEKFVKNIDLIQMTYSKIESRHGYVMVYFELSPEIKILHKNIVEILNPLREGYINPKFASIEYAERLSRQEMEMVSQYAYPYVMNHYCHPHLSLIRLEDVEEAKNIISNLKWNIKTFMVDKLVLHKIGDNGAAVEFVKEFDLK